MRILYVLVVLTAVAVTSLLYRSMTSEVRLDDDCPTTNWEGRYSMTAPTLLRPEHLSDIVDAVTEARRRESNLTIVGSGHSWSDIAVPTDVVVCMRSYNGLVSIDTDQRQVTFKAGTTLQDITITLNKYGWALENLPSISEQTIAGVIATGTHGTGMSYQNLASLVVSLKLVTANGKVLTISREDSNLFQAVTIGLGMFGIISEVTIQAVPAFNLHEKTEVLPLDYVLEHLNMVANSTDQVKLWVEMHSEKVLVYRQEKTEEMPRDNPASWWREFQMCLFEAMTFFLAFFRPFAPHGMRFLVHYADLLPEINHVDISQNILNIPHRIPLHPEAEVAVPMRHASRAIQILQDIVQEMNLGVNFITEVRFVRGDSFWMSSDFGHDTCHLTIMLYAQEDIVHDYFKAVEQRLLPLGGRPHWAKISYLNEAHLRSLFPKWDDFFSLKKRLDPEKVFCNKFLRRTFPSAC